jgi:hypothetical protein
VSSGANVDPSKPTADINTKTNAQLQTELSSIEQTTNTTQKFSFIMVSSISTLIDLHEQMQHEDMLNISVDAMFSSISDSLAKAKTFPEALSYLNNTSAFLAKKVAALKAEITAVENTKSDDPNAAAQKIESLNVSLNGATGLKTWVDDQLTAANAENKLVKSNVQNANNEHNKVESGGTQHAAGWSFFKSGSIHKYTTGVCSGEWHDYEHDASADRQAGLNAATVSAGRVNKDSTNALNEQFTNIKGMLTNTHTIDSIISTIGKMQDSEGNK